MTDRLRELIRITNLNYWSSADKEKRRALFEAQAEIELILQYMEKSHRDIKGERITDSFERFKEAEMRRAEGGQKIPDSLQPTIRTKARAKYRNFKQSIKNRVYKMFSKQTEKVIRKKVPDNTLWGKIIFGIFDAVPLPQMHEVWKAVQKEIPNAPLKDKLKLYWQKVDGVRTVASIVVSVLTAYFIANQT